MYAGYLISYPSVGRGMVIFRDPNGHRMVTTPVRRVLGAFDGEKLYRRANQLARMIHAALAETSRDWAANYDFSAQDMAERIRARRMHVGVVFLAGR